LFETIRHTTIDINEQGTAYQAKEEPHLYKVVCSDKNAYLSISISKRGQVTLSILTAVDSFYGSEAK